MKTLIALIFIVLFCLGFFILGRAICLSDGCCYTDPQEIADFESTLNILLYLWVALAITNIALIIFTLTRWIRRRLKKKKADIPLPPKHK